jgi:hypothetical protein
MEFADVGAGVVGVGATGDAVGPSGTEVTVGEECEQKSVSFYTGVS